MTQPAATPPTIMDPDAAYDVVHQRVYAPVFFQKLANDFGIVPADQQEAMAMLSMAAQMRAAHNRQQEKQAAQRPSMLASMQAHLNAQLQSMGMGDIAVAPMQQQQTKAAAAQASFDPEIAHAIMSMQALGNGHHAAA